MENRQKPASDGQKRPGGAAGGQQGPPGGSGSPQQSQPSGMPGPGGRGQGTRIEHAKDAKGTIRRLLAYLKPYRWAFGAVLGLVIVSTLLQLSGPVLTGRAIDILFLDQDMGQVLRVILIMLAVYFVDWIAQTVQSILIARAAQSAMRELRNALFEHLQTLSLSFFDKHPHGELMSRLTNDMQAISNVLTQNVTSLFSGILTLGGIIVMMFVLNVWLERMLTKGDYNRPDGEVFVPWSAVETADKPSP